MARNLAILLTTFCAWTTAFCEMAITVVRPENAKDLDVAFSLETSKRTSVYEKKNPNIRRIVLSIRPKEEERWVIGDPELHLVRDKKLVCKATLFSEAFAFYRKTRETKVRNEEKHWFEMNLDFVEESSLRIPVYPANPRQGLELCAQSTEYVLRLADFVSEQTPPNNRVERPR